MLLFITLPTRVTGKSNTLIDNIFLPVNNFFRKSGNLTIGISDHLPQFLFLNFGRSKPKQRHGEFYRNWSKFDPGKFREDFSTLDWNEILAVNRNDCEASFNSFYERFSVLYDKHVPLSKSTKRQVKLSNKPWITKGLLASISVRDSILSDLNNTSDPDLKTFLHGRYKFYRNKIVSLIRLSKRNHYSDYFRTNNTNLRKIWEGVREIISLRTKSNADISLQVNNTLISDPLSVAETFNDFFSSVASNVRSRIPPTRHHFSNWLLHANQQSFFISPTSPDEVLKILNSIKGNKASGPISIPLKLLEVISQELSVPLCKLINLYLLKQVFSPLN